MFPNLWQFPWDNNNQKKTIQNQTDTTFSLHFTESERQQLAECHNEDELADALLTRFPPFGSQNEQNYASEWLGFTMSQANDEEVNETNLNDSVHSAPLPEIKPQLWDDEEKYLWKKQEVDTLNQDEQEEKQQHEPLSRTHFSKQISNEGHNDTTHWMPDQLCNNCYGCEAPFTVFRRRHHCRLCGQVFCNTCSAHFVPRQRGINLRVCKFCYEQVNEKGGIMEAETPATPKRAETSFHSQDDPDETLQTRMSPGDVLQKMNDNRNTNRSFQDLETSASPTRIDKEASAIARIRGYKERPQTVVDTTEIIQEGNRHIGAIAAEHLEKLTEELLQLHSPIVWNRIKDNRELKESWLEHLLGLISRCCFTVNPNAKKGDMLDIRPYVKIKCVSGGSHTDSQYVSGIVFRNNVAHKQMAREIENPRVMLLSGGIEFSRTENKFTSLDTLLEQEDKYMEILVGKILNLNPDVLLVAKSVSRKAQELLLKSKVVLVQHVKQSLMQRISRQTGATIISSTDHVMNQFGSHVLGTCRRFRLVVFRDNEIWTTETSDSSKRSIPTLLADESLKTNERQAALAAAKLGEDYLDGSDAVRSGLAKRGVANTFVMLEGCPKHLGSTIVLRGAEKAALKQVKKVFSFLLNVGYNLRLETQYMRERRLRIKPTFSVEKRHLSSSSLCIDYGEAEGGRKVRPWNGSSDRQPHDPNEAISAYDFQSILITSIWMCGRSQCCPAEVKGICYYSIQDVALGSFLRDSCFNLSLKCQNPNCKKTVLDHSLAFVHRDGLVNISVEEMKESLPASKKEDNEQEGSDDEEDETDDDGNKPIATWTYCKSCDRVVTPLVFISDDTWKFSFGKFLEVSFYNRDAILNSPALGCSCSAQENAVVYFGCGNLAARFSYEPVLPYRVFVRDVLPCDALFREDEAVKRLSLVSTASSDLFSRFDKHISRISREARALLKTAVNRPEHLQTVISELSSITTEIDVAAKTLQEKIASVSEQYRRERMHLNDQILQFPWYARRYLFLLSSAWNEKLSATGQAIMVMKKISSLLMQRDRMTNASAVSSDPHNEELLKCMERLKKLKEYYSRYDVQDIDHVFPTLTALDVTQETEIEDDYEDAELSLDFPAGIDADVMASRQRLRGNPDMDRLSQSHPRKTLGTKRGSRDPSRSSSNNSDSAATQKATPGGAVKSALNRFFNRGGHDRDPYVVDLGLIADGRPRLTPGSHGMVPVNDDQWGSIIAYSLSSSEYAKQFQGMSKASPEESGSKESMERQMLVRNKSHIKHTFRDSDEKGQTICKFVCTSYWSTQFHAVRQAFLTEKEAKEDEMKIEAEKGYIESLMSAYSWAASGGKSGASFSRTSDDRFVIKCISRTELQMFLDCAPAYFEYLSKAFFHGLPTVLCKIVGVYQIGVHNRETGKRTMEQVAVMQNIFYNRRITKIFDLKGSLRGRFAANHQNHDDPNDNETATSESVQDRTGNPSQLPSGADEKGPSTLLDGDFLEYTLGRPMPLTDRAKALFQMSILNDTLFLSIINVLDYSILVGIDEEKDELVVGIIDFMRQYDILKQMERVGKSLPMVVGSEAPTIIQPPLYKQRFTNAMERYFMTVPSKFTTI